MWFWLRFAGWFTFRFCIYRVGTVLIARLRLWLRLWLCFRFRFWL